MIYLITALVLIMDQWFKQLIINHIHVYQSVPIIRNYLHLTYVQNNGAGFGILSGYRFLFIIISAVVVLGLLILHWRLDQQRAFLDVVFGLIIGGAAGNMIDRIRWGYVVDYLDFKIWPVFNLADAAVVSGVILLLFYLFRNTDANQAFR